jgi:predicted peroxiredoxin
MASLSNKNRQLILIFLSLISIFLYAPNTSANEIDIEKATELFLKMFGDEFSKVIATPSKTDDEKLAEDLITAATALASKPELQIFIKLKAGELLESSEKNKKKSRDLFLEVTSDLPENLQKEIAQKVYDLQKNILNSTPSNNKMLYADEVDTFVSLSQTLSSFEIIDSDFSNAQIVLKEALRYLRVVDKDAAAELTKKVNAIQKEANRFSQIQSVIKQLSTNPKDEKINLEIAEYYLYERNSIYMAWPYLDNLKSDTYSKFYYDIKKCISDEDKLTPDEISLALIPILNYHPEYFLNWLSKKDLVDPEEVVKKQTELLRANKKVQTSMIKSVMKNTIDKNGEKQEVAYQNYLSLVASIDALLELLSLNKKLDAESLAFIKEQLVTNKYIALMKANIKMAKVEPVVEIDKLKLELEIGKLKVVFKELKIDEFSVDISTPYTFQKNDLLFNKIEVNSEGLYTFDANSWNQFIKDFEISVSGNPYDTKDKKSLMVQDGNLVFCEKKAGVPYFFKAKKKKWTPNTEISFEILKDCDAVKQGLDFYFLLKPDSVAYTKVFAVYLNFFLRGGWFGIIREGEGFEAFTGNKYTKKMNPDDLITSLWKPDKDRLKISAIFKDNKFEIFINGESINSFPISNITPEKGFPNTPIQFYFLKRGSPIPEVPVKIDNLYIGPPRQIKK